MYNLYFVHLIWMIRKNKNINCHFPAILISKNQVCYDTSKLLGSKVKMDAELKQLVLTLIKDMVRVSIENILHGKTYRQDNANGWEVQLLIKCFGILSELANVLSLQVTCFIVERIDTEMDIISFCFWNKRPDGTYVMLWENETISCIVIIRGLEDDAFI